MMAAAAAELVFNFLANAMLPFLGNKWNWFDTVVVSASFVLLFASTGNGSVKALRILRVFRVIRVFGRIGQLREIVGAIGRSIVPAAQALLIALVVGSVYACIGVQYFGSEDPEDFCDFFHAFYTMFGIVAYSQGPPNLKNFDSAGQVRVGPIVYIYSFVAIIIFMLLQVVVAVLLESFFSARQHYKEVEARENAAKMRLEATTRAIEAKKEENIRAKMEATAQETVEANNEAQIREDDEPAAIWNRAVLEAAADLQMDPLMEKLADGFDTGGDLIRRIDALFDRIDVDSNHKISEIEVIEGLYLLCGARIDSDGFRCLTKGCLLSDGNLDKNQFRQAMVRQVKSFTQRRLGDALRLRDLPVDMSALLIAIKVAFLELEQVDKDSVHLRQRLGALKQELKNLNAHAVKRMADAAQRVKDRLGSCTPACLDPPQATQQSQPASLLQIPRAVAGVRSLTMSTKPGITGAQASSFSGSNGFSFTEASATSDLAPPEQPAGASSGSSYSLPVQHLQPRLQASAGVQSTVRQQYRPVESGPAHYLPERTPVRGHQEPAFGIENWAAACWNRRSEDTDEEGYMY